MKEVKMGVPEKGMSCKCVLDQQLLQPPKTLFDYWARYKAIIAAEFKNAHTVDERVSVNAHLSTIRFFYQLLQNVQGWRHGNEE